MKKLFLILAVLPIPYVSFAQSFGVQAGLNIASQSIGTTESGGYTISTSSRTGFLIGATAAFPISKSVSFRPELNYIQKGSKTVGETADEFVHISLNYIELPLNVVYSSAAGSGHVFFGAGPSIGYGLSGNTQIKSGGQDISADIKFDGKVDDLAPDEFGHLKALDFGLSFFAGYQFANGFFADAGYAFGLSNITPEAGSSLKNKGFSIKVGYMFKKVK
jgi:hypothetical protein